MKHTHRQTHSCGQSASGKGSVGDTLSDISPYWFSLRAISQKNKKKGKETLAVYGMLWGKIVLKKILHTFILTYLVTSINNVTLCEN